MDNSGVDTEATELTVTAEISIELGNIGDDVREFEFEAEDRVGKKFLLVMLDTVTAADSGGVGVREFVGDMNSFRTPAGTDIIGAPGSIAFMAVDSKSQSLRFPSCECQSNPPSTGNGLVWPVRRENPP